MQSMILVVEDEKKVAAVLKKSLEQDGYSVDVAHDGDAGEAILIDGQFDLVILDIMMPKKDGISLLKNVREKGMTVPVLMLTAKGTVDDRVKGLDNGADDYLVKPFAIDELLARVRSLLRRRIPEKSTTLTVGDLTLDLVKHNAQRSETLIELTAREYMLLEYFMQNKNKVLSRVVISEHIWNYNFDTGTNIIDVYINHLRAKIDGGFSPKLIHTVRGVGYMLKDSSA